MVEFRTSEHNRLARIYLETYQDCEPKRKINDRLNVVLHKQDLDHYLEESTSTSERLMTYLLNFIINYQRVSHTPQNPSIPAFFIIYSAVTQE